MRLVLCIGIVVYIPIIFVGVLSHMVMDNICDMRKILQPRQIYDWLHPKPSLPSN